MDSTTPSGKHRAIRRRLARAEAKATEVARAAKILREMTEMQVALRGLAYRLQVHREALDELATRIALDDRRF